MMGKKKKLTKAEKQAKREIISVAPAMKLEPTTIPVGRAEPVPTTPEEEKPPLMKGRTLRAWVGLGIIVVVAAVFVWDHVVLGKSFEILEITGQALLFGVGFLLIDKKLFAEFKGVILSRLGKK